ncbi:MAG: aldo/keto reductase [Rubrivivax sp.]|nr:MAG: aldo/keto reductase [Rubrivivax sp.]
MQYTRLGRTGLQVSRICLGMMTFGTPRWRPWILDEEASRPVVRHAVELGINFFDTADLYSAGESEVLTGRFLREFCKREEVVVATKLYYPVELEFKGGNAAGAPPPKRPNMSGLSRKRILHAVDHSLQRLGTDYIDLYQLHRIDSETCMEETMEALHDVVKAGKVRYIGASSMYAWQFAKMQQIAKERGWTQRDDKASGETSRAMTDDIAQKYYYRDSDFKVVENLAALAQRKGVSNATLAYAWLLHKGVTAPIVGASKPWQLDEAVAALEVSLDAEEMRGLESAYEPHPVLGHV